MALVEKNEPAPPGALPNKGGVPVTLFFERQADGRIYRYAEMMPAKVVSKREELFDQCLARWGSFAHPLALSFLLIVRGHVETLGSRELLSEYLRKAMQEDAP